MTALRFRCWHKHKKKMFKVIGLEGDDDVTWVSVYGHPFVDPMGGEHDAEVNHIPGDKVVLMQSTSLTDKNGVEIFEGDIVRSSEENGRLNRPEVVRYVESGFRPFCDAFNDGDTDWNVYGKTYEVIGNRWQNPELLTQAA